MVFGDYYFFLFGETVFLGEDSLLECYENDF